MSRSRAERRRPHTLPSSPTHSSSSSSDFEFTVCSSATHDESCSAGDMFYKGQLLPLHPSPRLSMVNSMVTASSSSSSNSRDSCGSSSFSESPRPSSVADSEDEFITFSRPQITTTEAAGQRCSAKKSKSFSLMKLSSVFNRRKKTAEEPIAYSSSSARDFLRKYVIKVKPLYEKMSHRDKKVNRSNSFSRNPRIRNNNNNNKGVVMMSCPSSIRSSPCRSGVLSAPTARRPGDSSMEQVQSAIQEAIAHCKSSMMQSKSGPACF